MPVTPSEQTLTIRFKNHKTTVVLHVERTQSFDSIATDLLEALKVTRPDGLLHGKSLPSDATKIHFAKLTDDRSPEAAWTALDPSDHDDGNMSDSVAQKPEGSRKRRKLSSGIGFVSNSPLAIGLKEGSMLAFRFYDGSTPDDARDGDEWDVVLPGFDDLDDEDEGNPAAEDDDTELPDLSTNGVSLAA